MNQSQSAFEDVVPAFIARAKADVAALRERSAGEAQDRMYGRRFRKGLARLGRDRVAAAWNAQLPVMSWHDAFRAVTVAGRSPSMGFVRDWLDTEAERNRMRTRMTFWGALIATVAVVMALVSASG